MATDDTMDVPSGRDRTSIRMSFFSTDRQLSRGFLARALAIALALTAAGLSAPARAQISLVTAVDLALRNNPRVLGARDEVRRSRAQLAETHDAYIPNASFGSNIGQAYGYLPYPPTLFSGNAGSLVYSGSQG